MIQALFAELLSGPQSPQVLVQQGLRLLEVAFRERALQALGDWDRTEIAVRESGRWNAELHSAIGALQRPSWGNWNGLLTALCRTRAACLGSSNEDVRRRVNDAVVLTENIQLLDGVADADLVASLQPLGQLTNVRLDGRVRLGRVLELPIALRNRVVHDTPADPDWWQAAAQALRPLLELHARGLSAPASDNRLLTDQRGTAPWILVESDEVWSFNGVEPDFTPIYVSRSGKSRHDKSRPQEILLAFQRLLGVVGSQERDFKALIARLAPEELKGVLFGDYLLGRPAGAGAFATVHHGRQLSTGRKVAIKVLRSNLDESQRLRFQQEAMFLAKLDHPNIVQVLGRGDETWTPPRTAVLAGEEWYEEFRHSSRIKSYIALEWVDGETLESVYRRSAADRPALESLVDWFAQAAEALAAVHIEGLTHRDVKPQNIMLTADGRIKLMDFGIARGGSEARTILTQAEQKLGTPEYMSPEQLRADAAAAEVGPASDVYSLCATFYELYTKSRLYHHDRVDLATVVTMKLQGEAPEVPRGLERSLPWEIETLLLGGLEHEPALRPASAAALAVDLRRIQANLPILYKRPPLLRRVKLFYRRNRHYVHQAAVSAVLLGVLAIAAAVLLSKEKQKIVDQRKKTEQAEAARAAASTQAELKGKEAEESNRKKIVEEYLNDMNDAASLFANARIDLLKQRLLKYRSTVGDDPRGFEWYYWWGLCHADRRTFVSRHGICWRVDVDSSGVRFASLARSGELTVWDTATGAELYTLPRRVAAFAFSPDGGTLATVDAPDSEAEDGQGLRTWDAATGGAGRSLGGATFVTSLAYSVDGKRILTGDLSGTVAVRDATTGRLIIDLTNNRNSRRDELNPRMILDRQSGPILDVAFHPRGTVAASAAEDGSVHVWNANTGRLLQAFRGETGAVSSIAFSPDGQLLASVSLGARDDLNDFENPGEILVRQVQDGKVIASFRPRPEYMPVAGDSDKVQSEGRTGDFRLRFTADGKRLVAAADRSVRVWEIPAGRVVGEFIGHVGRVLSMAMTPGGQIISAGEDAQIKLWDGKSPQQNIHLVDHPYGVRGVGVSPDGSRVAAVLEGGAVRNGERQLRMDSHQLFDVGEFDAKSGKEVTRMENIECWPWPNLVAYSKDGTKAAAGEVWNTATRQPLSGGGRPPLSQTAMAPDGNTLAVTDGRELQLWDLPAGRHRKKILAPLPLSGLPAFSPDGALVAAALQGGGVWVWTTAEGSEQLRLKGHADRTRAVAFAHDGKTLATGGDDQVVRLWNLSDGAVRFELRGHDREITSVRFSPDSRRLISTSGDVGVASKVPGEVKLWDTLTGRECLTLKGEGDCLFPAAVFSPDGRHIYAATTKLPANFGETSPGAILAWDAAPLPSEDLSDSSVFKASRPQRPACVEIVGFDRHVTSIRFSPSGERLVAVTGSGSLPVIDVVGGRLIGSLPGNKGPAVDVSFDASGRQLITVKPYWSFGGSQGGNELRVWDVELMQQTGEVTAFTGRWPLAAGFRAEPPGLFVFSAKILDDGRAPVRIHSLAEGAAEPETVWLPDFTGQCVEAHFRSDGRYLATLTTDNPGVKDAPRTFRLWDLASRRAICAIPGLRPPLWNLQFSADGKRVGVARGAPDDEANRGTIHGVRIWETETGRPAAAVESLTHARFPFALSADGQRFATAMDDTHAIRISSAADGKPIRTLPGPVKTVTALAFAPDDRTLACGTIDGPLQLWDLTQENDPGKQPVAIDGPNHSQDSFLSRNPPTYELANTSTGELTILFNNESSRVAFGAGNRLASFALDQVVRIWDTESRAIVGRWSDDRGVPSLHPASILAATFERDGKSLVTVSKFNRNRQSSNSDPAIELTRLDVATGKPTGTPLVLLSGASLRSGASQAVLSPSAGLVAIHTEPPRSTDSGLPTTHIWDVRKQSKVGESRMDGTMQFLTDDGQSCGVLSDNRLRIQTLSGASGNPVVMLDDPGIQGVVGCQATANARYVVAVFEGTEQNEHPQAQDSPGTIRKTKPVRKGPKRGTQPPRFKKAKSDSSLPITIVVWNLEASERLRAVKLNLDNPDRSNAKWCFAVSDDGSRVALGKGSWLGLFDTQTGARIGELNLSSSGRLISSITMQPDGNRLAIADYGAAIWLWNPGP